MIPDRLEWIADDKPLKDLCGILRDCQSGRIECEQTRTLYFGKPFESHARLHLWTLRPKDVADTTFHNRIAEDLATHRVHARLSYRYFSYGWTAKRDLIVTSPSQRVHEG
jgi:hypothetical protein